VLDPLDLFPQPSTSNVTHPVRTHFERAVCASLVWGGVERTPPRDS
jgi:hypothetical protein